MDAYQRPPQYMRPPSGPPPPTDPYHQYYQHQARPPVPPTQQPGGLPAWYPNQFHNPHSPSPPPPPPQQWGPPSSHFPQGQPYSSPAYPPHHLPFNPVANGNSQFRPPPGPPLPPPYPQANQEWGNPNCGYQQGPNSQGNSNIEDWAVKAKEWAAANKDQQPQSAPNQPNGQIYQQQFTTHSYQDAHQQAAPELMYQQQLPVPSSTQLEIYPNYSTGNESFPGGSSTVLSHQQNLPTSSAIHQQEVPYSYSSVSGREGSGNARQHEVQISAPVGGGSARTEQLIQYAYGDQTTAPPSNLRDQHIQFSTRENSDYTNVHNAWQPHSTTGVVYPPIPSSVPSISHHDSSMVIPPVSGHSIPPYGSFPPPNLQPVGPPYSFGTKPPLHPGAAFMDDSYAASTVTPKKAPVPNWLKEELLKKKADLGRSSLESFEERVSMDDDDVLYKPPVKADQRDKRSFSSSKSSDEEEEEDEDEMDAARTTAINMEIKRILTEVLLKVTDELFDEIATKVINEDEVILEDDRVQHSNKLSSSLLSTADPLPKASTKILVSVEGSNNNANSVSTADVLGLASYASDDDDADTDVVANADAVSKADADGHDGVESLGMGSRYSVSQQPSPEKLPEAEAMANAKLDIEVEVDANSGNNCKSGSEDYSLILDSRRKEDEAGRTKLSDVSASSGLDNNTSGSRKKHPDRAESDKDGTLLDETHRTNSGLISDCNLHHDSNKTYGKDSRDDVSRDRSRPDETKSRKEKVDSQNGSKDRMKQDLKLAEKLKGVESNKKSADPHVKKDSRDVERPHRTNSKEDRCKKREKEKEEERSRHRKAEDSSKDKRRRSPTSNESSDDSLRKSRSRRRNVSPSPVRSRRKRPSPSSDESSDDSRRKSSSRRRNRSPSPGRSRRRHVSSRSPHSKHSQRKQTLYSSHDKSRSKRSRSRSPHRRHRAK